MVYVKLQLTRCRRSEQIAWTTLDTSVLHSYRHAYRLNTPSAFSRSMNRIVLANPGIGRYSPTMARQQDRRRVGKEQLALAVRKNFNALAIHESEVIVDFIYSVKHQGEFFLACGLVFEVEVGEVADFLGTVDKSFRMRFAPQRNR